MNILYLGDVMAEPGLQLLERELPAIRSEYAIDLVVAQAENVTQGKGISVVDFQRLQQAGVDFCTGGNHTITRDEIFPLLDDPKAPIIRPANYPLGTPGLGYKYIDTPSGKVLVVSLLGQIVGKDASKLLHNPLKTIDDILHQESHVKKAATVVNLHGDFSSEKVVIGHYLDGRASIVVGDHWHVPTADARILPGGTAHMTDVGMCGILESSLGVAYDSIVPRWRDGRVTKNVIAIKGPKQMNGIIVAVGQDGLAQKVTPLRRIFAASSV